MSDTRLRCTGCGFARVHCQCSPLPVVPPAAPSSPDGIERCPDCGHDVDAHSNGTELPIGCHVVTDGPGHRCVCRLSHHQVWRALVAQLRSRLSDAETRYTVAEAKLADAERENTEWKRKWEEDTEALKQMIRDFLSHEPTTPSPPSSPTP